MFNKKQFVYPINLVRVNKDFSDRHYLVKGSIYVHKRDLTSLLNRPIREINFIIDEIANRQPEGMSDEESKEYFNRQMRKRGFREVEFPKTIKVQIDYPYLCRFTH